MARIQYIPNRVIDTNGISDGANVHVYQSGTTTHVALFSDSSMTVPIANPIVVPSGAEIPVFYTSYTGLLRLRVVESGGDVSQDEDPYSSPVASAELAGSGGASSIGLSQGGTTQDAIQYLTPRMFGAVGDGVTDDTTALQAALNAAGASPIISGRRRKPVIDLGSGVYRVTQTLTVGGTDFIIRGAGAQSCEILVDQIIGVGVSYTTNSPFGFCEFSGFVIRASTTRAAYVGAGAANLHGFLSDPGVGSDKTTFRMRFINVFSLDHPGDCFRIIQPEQLLMDDCAGNRSKFGHGIYIWGRDLPNISGVVQQTAVEGNALNGLYSLNMNEMTFDHIRALNSIGAGGQIKIEGENCTMSNLDCEAFDVITGTPPAGGFIGLSVSGRLHKITGGGFFALTKGIRLLNADDCIIEGPRFQGRDSTYVMDVGVSFESGSDNNYLKTSTFSGNNVTADYTITSGNNNRIDYRGFEISGSEGFNPVEAFGVSGSYTPDATTASYFRIQVTGATTINLPTGFRKGQILKIEITQGGAGGYAVAFASGYGAKFSNIGNTVGNVSVVNFICTGTTTIQQDGAQSPWVALETNPTLIAFPGVTVNAGLVSVIYTTAFTGAAFNTLPLAQAYTDTQGAKLNMWVPSAGNLSYQFENPTAGNITIAACNIGVLLKRLTTTT